MSREMSGNAGHLQSCGIVHSDIVVSLFLLLFGWRLVNESIPHGEF